MQIKSLAAIITGLFFATPLLCSEIPITYDTATLLQMNRLNMNAMHVSQIIRNGTRIALGDPNKAIYVCKNTGNAIAINESTQLIVSVMNESNAYQYLAHMDSEISKKRIRR